MNTEPDYDRQERPIRLAFVFIAEAYQVFHGAAVLFELIQRPGVEVDVYYVDPETPQQLDRLASAHGVPLIDAHRLKPGLLGKLIQGLRVFGLAKPQVLAANEPLLRGYDAILSTEDGITTLFRGEPESQRPARVLITHGAGGRQVPSHSGRVDCDLVLVKGRKDVASHLANKFARPGHIAEGGYTKFVSTGLLSKHSAPLFANDRPIVLYNPHKERKERSWEKFFEPIMSGFRGSDEMNLIVAPHIKLFRRRSHRTRESLRARSSPNIIVDPGSNRSLDNSYTEAADIYVGDVSSQVFEFLARPRPCVFLNANRIAWEGKPHYAMWNLGEVIEDPAEVMEAIRRAPSLHPDYVARQVEAVRNALGDTSPASVTRSADLILEYLVHRRVGP